MKPLILCACCALLLNIILPRIMIGFIGVVETIALLTGIAIIFAYGIAHYYGSFNKQTDQKITVSQPLLAVQASIELAQNSDLSKESEEKLSKNVHKEHELPSLPHKVNTAETDNFNSLEKQENFVNLENHNAPDKLTSSEDQLPSIRPVEKIDVRNEKVIPGEAEELLVISNENVQTPVTMAESIEIHSPAGNSIIVMDKPKEIAESKKQTTKAPKVDLPDAKIVPAIVKKRNNFEMEGENESTNEKIYFNNPVTPEDPHILTQANKINVSLNLDNNNSILNMEENNMSDSMPEDLDTLLDLAFMHKEQRNFSQAFVVFHQALTLYPDSEAAPFLVMEIGNILKNNGQYDEAIQFFCKAKKLPGIQNNNMFELEFVKMIAYLRIVKNILLQYHLGFISFNNIPEPVLKEIDAEFRAWRNPA